MLTNTLLIKFNALSTLLLNKQMIFCDKMNSWCCHSITTQPHSSITTYFRHHGSYTTVVPFYPATQNTINIINTSLSYATVYAKLYYSEMSHCMVSNITSNKVNHVAGAMDTVTCGHSSYRRKIRTARKTYKHNHPSVISIPSYTCLSPIPMPTE